MKPLKTLLVRGLSYAIPFIIIVCMWQRINNLNTLLDNAVNNQKAIALENGRTFAQSLGKSVVYQYKIDELKFYNDSLTVAMKKIANDNKIKDKRIKALQYQLEHYVKVDTIRVRDTIFREPGFVLDTCMVDEWNKNCLHMEYPGTIILDNEYKNDKFVTLSSHKEPVKPRKWFLPRWFTRKHIVVEVMIVDKNPNVITPQQRYIEIIDN